MTFKQNPTITLFFFLFKVQDKLRFDPESEIATTGLRVSLICPVSTHFWRGTSHCSASHTCLTHSLICCIFTTVFPFLFFFAVGEDATRCAVSGFDLCPSAMFRRSLLPADEWEEAHVDLPRLWQACTFRAPYYRWVSSKKHVETYPLLQNKIPFSRFIGDDFMPPVVLGNTLEPFLRCKVVSLVVHRYCVIIMTTCTPMLCMTFFQECILFWSFVTALELYYEC